MRRFGQIYTRKKFDNIFFDIRISDLDSENPLFEQLKNGKIGDKEVDRDYAWVFNFVNEVIKSEDQYEYEYEDENENENEDDDVDENDKDPQYRMFLENLTEHGKSYKLKISKNDKEPRFVYYEEPDNSDWCDELQTSIENSGDEFSTKKEVSGTKKINDHESMIQHHRGITVDSSYQMFLNNYIPSGHCAIKTEEDVMEYENNVTTCDSDSDIMILDNVQNFIGVNNKQLVYAEKESSLREKLMHILEKPFDEKEYEELSEYIEQKKPVCRLLDLRGRAISSAFSGEGKSVLDDGPGSFRRMLNASQNDQPKALNLLRMFCFWLEHVPNEDVFVPWRDKQILKVRPSEKKALQIDTLMLIDK